MENCATLWNFGKLNDDACKTSDPSHGFCSICNFTRMPELKLRGLCSFLVVDIYFTMITSSLKNRRYHMQGWTHSNIEWHDARQEWQIRSVKHSGVIASCNETKDYPLGARAWYFKDQVCSEEGQPYRLLNLHTCLHGEIPCRNGDCIPVESRCSTNVTRVLL